MSLNGLRGLVSVLVIGNVVSYYNCEVSYYLKISDLISYYDYCSGYY